MGRFTNLVMFLIVLQVVLCLFEGSTPANTSLWQVVTHPEYWNNMAFIIVISGISLGIFGTAAFIGTIAGLKTDFMVFSAMIPGLLSLGVPIYNFAVVIGKYTSNVFCGTPLNIAATTYTSCAAANFAVYVTGGILAVYYIFTVLDWWRGRD